MKANDIILSDTVVDAKERLEKLIRHLQEYDPAVAKHYVDRILDAEEELYLDMEVFMLETLQRYLSDQNLVIEMDSGRIYVTERAA